MSTKFYYYALKEAQGSLLLTPVAYSISASDKGMAKRDEIITFGHAVITFGHAVKPADLTEKTHKNLARAA